MSEEMSRQYMHNQPGLPTTRELSIGLGQGSMDVPEGPT